MIAHDIARYAMQLLKDTGAQQYSAQAHTAQKHEFNVDGGLFSLLRTTFDNRLDLTLIKDSRRGKELINEFSQAAVQAAVKDCLASSDSAEPDEAWQMMTDPQKEFAEGPLKGNMDKLFLRAQEEQKSQILFLELRFGELWQCLPQLSQVIYLEFK